MQTIHSRTYTNVALTVLILLLLVLVARPYIGLEKAYAGSLSDESASKSAAFKDPYADATAALREIATSNKDIASAIRETAKSQADVARALAALSAAAK